MDDPKTQQVKPARDAETENSATEPVQIFAWDYSGSTIGVGYYHQIGEKYLQEFIRKASTEEPIYLTWTDKCKQITVSTLRSIIKRMEGDNDTRPSTIINWITKNLPKNQSIELWLITDGEILPTELQECARLNEEINYASINFIVINRSRINMSVGASFFRGAHLKIFYNNELMKEINTSVPFDYASINIDNFGSKWETLSDFIQAKFMGSDLDGLKEADKLISLRDRLFEEILARDSAADGGKNAQTQDPKFPVFPSRNKSDILAALMNCQFYKSLTTPAVVDLKSKIEVGISKAINFIHTKHKSYDFDNLKMSHKQDQIEYVADEPELELESLTDTEICTFYDAVSLEDEETAPVLLLTVTDLILQYWVHGNYSKFRTITECPLMAKIDDCVGHVFSFETFKALCAHDTGVITNPLTNEPVYGGLIFSEKADDWNDYVVFKTFFRGKKVKTCLALWYYSIWELAKNKAWIEPGVIDLFKIYALRRMTTAKVKLGFSSLPLDPQEVVPIPIACFYCTEGSSLLFGRNTLFLQERLRQFWPVAKTMLDIMDHLGFDGTADKEFVLKRAKVFEILGKLKRIPQDTEKRYFLLQNAFKSHGEFLTYNVKDKSALGLLNLLKYHHKRSIVPFDYNVWCKDFRPFVLLSYDYESKTEVKICPETLRPYFAVSDSNSNNEKKLVPYYNQVLSCLTETTLAIDGTIFAKNPVSKLDQRKLLSLNKMYIDLTHHLKKFPTIDEYREYVFKTKKFCGDQVRLFPPRILEAIEEGFAHYSSLGCGVEEFIKRTQSSISVVDRLSMENLSLGKLEVEEFAKEAKSLLVNHIPRT